MNRTCVCSHEGNGCPYNIETPWPSERRPMMMVVKIKRVRGGRGPPLIPTPRNDVNNDFSAQRYLSIRLKIWILLPRCLQLLMLPIHFPRRVALAIYCRLTDHSNLPWPLSQGRYRSVRRLPHCCWLNEMV